MKSPQELAARFRAEGRKVTPQRQHIFDVLSGNDEHLTAEGIWAQVRRDQPKVSLRTVYQTLYELADLDEIQVLDLGTGAARFDPNLDAHHHLVCDGCGQVHDLYADFNEVHVPTHASHGFQISGTEIVFRGKCAACATAPGSTQGPAHGEPRSAPNPRPRHRRGKGTGDRNART